jgi:TolA-binding protein
MAKREQISVPVAISAAWLKLAQTLDGQGKVHEALAAYLTLIERYPASLDAPIATDRVLAIAEDFRKRGQFHVAMGVFDRLEAAHAPADSTPA